MATPDSNFDPCQPGLMYRKSLPQSLSFASDIERSSKSGSDKRRCCIQSAVWVRLRNFGCSRVNSEPYAVDPCS